MDQEQLKQKIVEYYGKLPKEAQVVFSSMTWMETLKSISAKYGLNNNQIEILGTETTLVLLGIIHIEEYQKILEKELGLEKEITEKIIIEIDENILKTIKGQLVEVFESNAGILAEEKHGGDKKLDERFSGLPEDIQEAIALSNWKEKLYEIAPKYKLNIEQMGILEEVTTKVMLDIIHPDKYEEELASKITISKEDISNLVKDVNEEILKTIRELLKKHWDENGSKEYVVSSKDNGIKEEIPIPPYAKIEIKAVETPKNIIEEKLKNPTVSERIVSDHSIPKISDPYREAF